MSDTFINQEAALSCKKFWSVVRKKWGDFFLVLSQPVIFLLIWLILGLGVISVISKNFLMNSLLTSFIAILAGVCGAMIYDKYCKLELITQGKNTVRDLKLTQSYLSYVKTSLNEYQNIAVKKKWEVNPEVLESWLKETIKKIDMIEKHGIASIEGWSSYMPETDITTKVEERDNLQNKISNLMEELKTLKDENTATKNERVRLNKELIKAQEELQQKDLQLQRSIYGINNSDRPTSTTGSFNYLSILANSDLSSSNIQNKLGLSPLSSLFNSGETIGAYNSEDNVKG